MFKPGINNFKPRNPITVPSISQKVGQKLLKFIKNIQKDEHEINLTFPDSKKQNSHLFLQTKFIQKLNHKKTN